MEIQKGENSIAKGILWMIIIGMVSYVGWSVFQIYQDIASIQAQTNEYNQMIFESIENTAEKQAEKVKSIKTVK